MIKHSISLSISFVFIYINSLVWLVFGLIIVFDAHPTLPDIPFYKLVLAFLAITISVILFVMRFFIARRNLFAFKLTIGLLFFTSLSSIFDDFGLVDLAFMILNLIPLVLLIKERRWYLKLTSQTEAGGPN